MRKDSSPLTYEWDDGASGGDAGLREAGWRVEERGGGVGEPVLIERKTSGSEHARAQRQKTSRTDEPAPLGPPSASRKTRPSLAGSAPHSPPPPPSPPAPREPDDLSGLLDNLNPMSAPTTAPDTAVVQAPSALAPAPPPPRGRPVPPPPQVPRVSESESVPRPEPSPFVPPAIEPPAPPIVGDGLTPPAFEPVAPPVIGEGLVPPAIQPPSPPVAGKGLGPAGVAAPPREGPAAAGDEFPAYGEVTVGEAGGEASNLIPPAFEPVGAVTQPIRPGDDFLPDNLRVEMDEPPGDALVPPRREPPRQLVFLQEKEPPVESLADIPEDYQGDVPASFGRRLAASLADGALVAGMMALHIAGAGVGLAIEGVRPLWLVTNPWPAEALLPFFLLGLLVGGVYSVWGVWRGGQTPGKRLLGIRVTDERGRPLTFGGSVARWLGSLLSALPLGIGFLWVLADREGRGWNDRLAGARVVQTRRRR